MQASIEDVPMHINPFPPPYSHPFPAACASRYWPLILYLMIGAVHGVAGIRSTSRPDSNLPTHSNFLNAALRGRQKYLWCAGDPNVCLDREKNPWGGSTCCSQRFCKDTANDPDNCGDCGHTCVQGQMCCGGRCVDIRNDPDHCGSCYDKCPGQLRCSFAMCDYGGG